MSNLAVWENWMIDPANDSLKRKIEELEKENKALKKKLKNLKRTISRLKAAFKKN